MASGAFANRWAAGPNGDLFTSSTSSAALSRGAAALHSRLGGSVVRSDQCPPAGLEGWPPTGTFYWIGGGLRYVSGADGNPFLRILRTSRGILHELAGGVRLAADLRSFLRYGVDVFLFRLLGLVDLPTKDRKRRIRLRGGVELNYRLNRGDIQSIREVWIDEAYRLPFDIKPDILIDLGANIGLTSLWMARRYGCTKVLAVEPSASNALFARLNLTNNAVPAEVIQAAIGPRDGSAFFAASPDSNLGSIAVAGEEVRMVSMPSLLKRLPAGTRVDLVKMDIEGGEEALLSGDVGWLGSIRSIIAEFHPDRVDYARLISRLQESGFRYLPPGSVHPGSMDSFIRVVE